MWVRREELVELGVSNATIYRKDRAGEWKSRRARRQGPTGQPQKEFLLSSLPAELQVKYAKLEENRASAVSDSESPVRQITDDDRLSRLQVALARFSPPQYTLEDRLAVERHCVAMAQLYDEAGRLIRYLKRERKMTVPSPGAMEAGQDRAYNPDLHSLAQRAVSSDSTYLKMYPSAGIPPSVSTLIRALSEYRKSGPAVFIPQRQTVNAETDQRFKSIPSEALDWLRANLRNYVKTSVTHFGRAWLAAARMHSWKLPFAEYRPGREGSCYAWLHRWKSSVPAVAMAYARGGEREVDNKFAYIIRDYSSIKPRVGFTMDWRQFDIAYWNPATGKSRPVLTREWICPALDLASRAIFGFYIDKRPSARGITLAYLDAIGESAWKNLPGFEMLRGMQRTVDEDMPAFVLWDNGKDFRSKTVEGEEITIRRFDPESGLVNVLQTYKVGLAPELTIKVRHAKPFNAKSKIIERWFKELADWEKCLPGYCGNKPDNKPFYFLAARRIHEAFIKRKDPKPAEVRQLPPLWREQFESTKAEHGFGTPFLIADDFKSRFVNWLIGYLKTPIEAIANERGMMSPLEFLDLKADSPHMLTEKAIAALALVPKRITLRGGEVVVQWSRERFVYREAASDLSDGRALYWLPEKAQVEFRYNPNNIGRALVLYAGEPLCWTEEPALMGYSATETDFVEANRKKKEARSVAKEFFSTRLDRPDWRDEAEARQETVELRAVVNGPDESRGQGSGIGDQEEPTTDHRPPATVIVPTRFDRRSPESGRPALRVVESGPEEEWADDLPEVAPVEIKNEKWKEPWEE